MTTFFNIGLFILCLLAIIFFIFGIVCLSIVTVILVKLYKFTRSKRETIKTAEGKVNYVLDTIVSLVDKVKNFSLKDLGLNFLTKGNKNDQ